MNGNTSYFLAVDMGASGGRHILGCVKDGKIVLEEVYRFSNGIVEIDGQKCWDCDELFRQIIIGMQRCKEIGKIPVCMSVDTWGVDFVLLDKNGNRLGNAVAYRDDRTAGMERLVFDRIPESELFQRTGAAYHSYNTLYQLIALKEKQSELLNQADCMLMSPDYYHWRLTGKRSSEYTIASTTQLLNENTKDWDWELIDLLELPRRIFLPVMQPGTCIGGLTNEVQTAVGYDCDVMLPCSHDTASAVFAVPTTEETVFISSGTWSLMGVELKQANLSLAGVKAGYSNEGGYGFSSRYLKNIMGLWIIQQVRQELNCRWSYQQLCDMAEEAKAFPSRIDVNDEAFFSPVSMCTAIRENCKKTEQSIPNTPGEFAGVVYHSLAESYGQAVRELERITGKEYRSVSVVGGGSNADYLNRLTAQSTGKTVYAGPGEATAIGNLAVQMLHNGVFSNRDEVRECICRSFEIKQYMP